jgi:hypothetical protein
MPISQYGFLLYSFPLAPVAAVVGLLYAASHGWAAWRPEPTLAWLRASLRHDGLGWALLAVVTLWFTGLLATMDLMEYTPHRSKFVLGTLVLGGLCAYFMREFLVVRSFGALLLLAAQILLDAAFLRDEASRLVVTLTAYGWIIAGMFMVGSPYLVRDLLDWMAERPARFVWAARAGAGFGVLLVGLAVFVY